jgi:diketogulonate reductase-like aldo/keto reductase
LSDPTLTRVGAAHGCSAAAVALAWTIRSGNVIAVPESGFVAHVKENAVALPLTLTPQEIFKHWMQRIRRPASVITAFALTLESAGVCTKSLLPKLCRLNVEGFMA